MKFFIGLQLLFLASGQRFNDTDLGGFARDGGGSVNPVNQLTAKRVGANFAFSWDYDAAHVSFGVSYTQTVGNYEATGEASAVVEITAIADPDDASRMIALFAQPSAGAQFRFEVFAYDGAALGGVQSVSSIVDAQSDTADVAHLPGTPYEGGGGYGATVLLPTDFSNAAFFKADLADTVGYTAAFMVTFPAGCESISVSADVDASYIMKDDAIADKHLIFVFPSTHFSNQFTEIRFFHYYVSGSNYDGCDLSDPMASVTVTDVSATYFERVTDEPADMSIMGMWPSDPDTYPPAIYTEQHQVNLSDLIQPSTHEGINKALSAPRITIDTAGTHGCNVIFNVEEGQSNGWGYVNAYDSNLSMTDLWSDSPTSNTASSFKLASLPWLTYIGVAFRYDTNVDNCETITTSATRSYVQLNSAQTLSKYENA